MRSRRRYRAADRGLEEADKKTINRRTRETNIRLKIEASRTLRRPDRHRFLDHMLVVGRRARSTSRCAPVRPRRRSTHGGDRRIAPAKRRRGARVPPRHQSADIQMPMDETPPLAIDPSGRPHAVGPVPAGRARRRSVPEPVQILRKRPGRARANVRQGALRTLEPSPGRGDLRGCPRACVACRKTGARECVARRRACCDDRAARTSAARSHVNESAPAKRRARECAGTRGRSPRIPKTGSSGRRCRRRRVCCDRD